MAYAELTTEQKASLDAWMTLLRASVGELARVNASTEPGDLVWVEEDDDVKDAIFSAHDEDGAILAIVEGETQIRKIPAGNWTAVGQ